MAGVITTAPKAIDRSDKPDGSSPFKKYRSLAAIPTNDVKEDCMNRRRLLLGFSGVGIAGLSPRIGIASTPEDHQRDPSGVSSPALAAVFGRLVDAQLSASPEDATALGIDQGLLATRLDERSLANRESRRVVLQDGLKDLEATGGEGLTARDAIHRDAIREILRVRIAAQNFAGMPTASMPYVISQLTGGYQSVPGMLASQQRVEDAAGAEAYLDRMAAFARICDNEIEAARHDAALGVLAPGFVLAKTSVQLKALRDGPADVADMVQALVRKAGERGVQGDWRGRATTLYEERVRPALDRQLAFVDGRMRSATSDAGIWKLPEGEAAYVAALDYWTTSGLDADEIHEIGLSMVADLSHELDGSLNAIGLSQGSVGVRLAHLAEDSRYLYPVGPDGRRRLLDDLNAQLAEVSARLPAWFGVLPKAQVQIEPVPATLEAGRTMGYYSLPPIDGSRAGTFYINLRDPAETPAWRLKTLVYHEALPGHHLQLALQLEAGLPLIRKINLSSAYSEGWGLYSEQLADEMGLYESDPAGRIGYLHSTAYRAARLVIDTGLHAKRWTRDQAVQYFLDIVGGTRSAAISEVERYCVWPGQACSYMLGKRAWIAARDRAQAVLGPAFDIRKFHDAGLSGGAAPLAVLDRLIEQYVTDAERA